MVIIIVGGLKLILLLVSSIWWQESQRGCWPCGTSLLFCSVEVWPATAPILDLASLKKRYWFVCSL